MNIKQAKDEIRHTVQAYLTKDALGDYAIPVVRQRPILPVSYTHLFQIQRISSVLYGLLFIGTQRGTVEYMDGCP